MKRYKCIVEYDGQNYSGFQSQQNAVTIQDKIEEALENLFKEKTPIVASGRTDSGVSAKGQVIHFDSNNTIPANKIPFALKFLLPDDISIIHCEVVNSDFHARFSAKAKTYSYKICLTGLNRPLYNKYYLYPYKIDIALLKKSLDKLVGKHDYSAFMATGSTVHNCVREITEITMRKLDNISFEICVTANGFLYNMMRIIIGTCLDIARGRLPENTIEQMLSTGDRSLGGHTAPATPLCLEKVYY